jgi:D-glycero-alpha-D-manno-heptose-7-phosphate kinase
MARTTSRIELVTTITPHRLSFFGGGSDFAGFYRRAGGAVISTTLDKYLYVTVKRHSPLFGEAYRLNYSITEHVNSIEEIRNDIIRESLRLVPLEPPIYISTVGDLPAFSGLGSSSSFAVGLLNALHMMRGEQVSAGQLAEEACHIEITALGRPIGKQDQYAAAFGGLNHFRFLPDERVTLDHLWLGDSGIDRLFAHSLMLWTGVLRNAADVLTEQKTNIDARMTELTALKDLCDEARTLLLTDLDLEKLGRLLDRGWQTKRTLASTIATPQIDAWYDAAMAAGAWGGKLAGAGGGGFLYILAPRDRHNAIRAALAEMQEIAIGYEPRGTAILAAKTS